MPAGNQYAMGTLHHRIKFSNVDQYVQRSDDVVLVSRGSVHCVQQVHLVKAVVHTMPVGLANHLGRQINAH